MVESEKTEKESANAPAGEDITRAPHDPDVEEAYTADIKGAIPNTNHDDAADLFASSEDVFQYTKAEASKVRWKLDLIILLIVRI